jgi:uncharacterized membrane protein YkvI
MGGFFMDSQKNGSVWKVAGVYATVIIGAGFASGQELLKFFAEFGYRGVFGLVIAGALFAVVGWAVLDICRVHRFSGYRELMRCICGDKIGLLIEITAALFMYVLFTTMLAGVGATFHQVFNINFTLGVCVAAAFTFAALLFDLEGLVAVNARIAPFLVAGGLMIGSLTLWRTQLTQPVYASGGTRDWLAAALVYASYNIITAVSVLTALSSLTKTKKSAMLGGVLGGGVMTLLGLCMVFPLYVYYTKINQIEIPLLYVTKEFGLFMEYFYFVLLLCAIFSTAISSAFALSRWLNDRAGAPLTPIRVILVIAGCLTAHIGFSQFVGRVYPIFSLVGFLQIILILIAWIKQGKA